MDASIELVQSVKIKLPNGNLREQEVHFGHEPKFCSTYKVFGHSTLGCEKKKEKKKKGRFEEHLG